MKGPADVVVAGVRLETEGKAILDDIDLLLPSGRLTALLGPSGAGKTSLLKVLAGLETPQRGRVEANGEVWSDAAAGRFVEAQRRGVGLVFQSYALWPHMSVFDNVAYPLRVRGLAKDELRGRVARALELARLPESLGTRRPGSLSGGEQQRVALARALSYEPSLLLLDEPLANLDAPSREGVRAEIRQVQRRAGVTTLYVTHDQAEALAMADNLAVMSAGRIVERGAPRDVYERPATPFTARFLGARSQLRGVARGGLLELAGGMTLEAPHVPDGEAAVALLRPDDVELEPPAGRLAWEAVVAAAAYAGDRVRCELELPGGGRVLAECPVQGAPEPGARVRAAPRPGRAKVYRDEVV